MQRDRKITISVLMQSTVESADCCGKYECALKMIEVLVEGPISNLARKSLKSVDFC